MINHIGFLVRDLDSLLAKWKAASVKIVMENLANRQVFIMSPDGTDQRPLASMSGQAFTPHWGS